MNRSSSNDLASQHRSSKARREDFDAASSRESLVVEEAKRIVEMRIQQAKAHKEEQAKYAKMYKEAYKMEADAFAKANKEFQDLVEQERHATTKNGGQVEAWVHYSAQDQKTWRCKYAVFTVRCWPLS